MTAERPSRGLALLQDALGVADQVVRMVSAQEDAPQADGVRPPQSPDRLETLRSQAYLELFAVTRNHEYLLEKLDSRRGEIRGLMAEAEAALKRQNQERPPHRGVDVCLRQAARARRDVAVWEEELRAADAELEEAKGVVTVVEDFYHDMNRQLDSLKRKYDASERRRASARTLEQVVEFIAAFHELSDRVSASTAEAKAHHRMVRERDDLQALMLRSDNLTAEVEESIRRLRDRTDRGGTA
ncbi:hypothetical protein [Streptomyces sp. I05A-00742]|uniref:hypothetical protein n=1 Tax=Streptomyces sp. I05A-00742 TaxID=2732853 RepID=UPI001489C262|nr:hypothetical protein [Streptomyces sp. I05A-00742]